MTEKSDAPRDWYSEGMATRRSVLGAAYVDRTQDARTDFDTPFQRLITESAWGHVWSRPNITKRERSMITLALLAALGQWDELALHTRATANTGASAEDIREAMLHVGIYAGVPAANHAMKIVKQTLAEMKASEGK
ncbi:MAG: 4-carboxymuconolactone decarboxylase [Rhizobiaceae bacterium]|mgnify:FL=1|jgi:4-carboxymuconolactone decarboxylase|nr:4-carboxymuconolactone decarboxylase [Hyphomicrobiales bacterium]